MGVPGKIARILSVIPKGFRYDCYSKVFDQNRHLILKVGPHAFGKRALQYLVMVKKLIKTVL